MAENERGFHHPAGQGHNHNRGGSSGSNVAERFGKRGAASEPTNHAGHTHEVARRHEHDARVEAVRSAHNSHHHAAPGGPKGDRQHGADMNVRQGKRETSAEEAHEA